MSNDRSISMSTITDENDYGREESDHYLNQESFDAPFIEFNDKIIVCRNSIPLSLISRINDETAPRHISFFIFDERGEENLASLATQASKAMLNFISESSIVCLWEFRRRNQLEMLNSIAENFGALIAGIFLSLSEPHFPALISLIISDGHIQYEEIEPDLIQLLFNS